MYNLHVMVGIPGSGKSTLAKTWEESGLVDFIISSDALREKISGDAGDISKDGQMWKEFHAQIGLLLPDWSTWPGAEDGDPDVLQDIHVVADATHLTAKAWAAYKQYTIRDDVNCYAHFVLPNNVHMWSGIDVCFLRNKERERVVPEEAMRRMVTNWEQIIENEDIRQNYKIVWHRT